MCVSAPVNLQSALYSGSPNVFPFLFKHQLLESCDLCRLWEVSCLLVAKMSLKASNKNAKFPLHKKKKKDLDFSEPVSPKKVWISIYCVWLYCSLSSSLQSSREKPAAHLPLAAAMHVLHTCGLDVSKGELPLSLPSASFPWLQHFSLQGCQSVTNTKLIAASITAVPRAARSCPAPGRAAKTVLPRWTHGAPSGTAPAAAAAAAAAALSGGANMPLPAQHSHRAPQEVTPGTGGKTWPCVLESRDCDPQQLYWAVGDGESSFSCFHKGLLVGWAFSTSIYF